jgi:hypothetical protein
MNTENSPSEAKVNAVLHGVIPRFCFICGTKLMEVVLGWVKCESAQCGEVYFPFIDENNNQCLMHQRTPFSPK